MKKKAFSLIFLFLVSLSFMAFTDNDDNPVAEREDDSPSSQQCHTEWGVTWVSGGIGLGVPVVYSYEVCD